MSQIHIIVGSQMGSAEYVAEHIAQLLDEENIAYLLHEQPNYQDLQPTQPQTWLICTSTYGAGDYPENLLAFVDQVDQCNQLDHVQFAVIGLGDSSYDTFNYAAKNIDELLQSKQAKKLIDRLEIDVLAADLPEDTAQAWLPKLLTVLNTNK